VCIGPITLGNRGSANWVQLDQPVKHCVSEGRVQKGVLEVHVLAMCAATAVGIIGLGNITKKLVDVWSPNAPQFDVREMRLDQLVEVGIVSKCWRFESAQPTILEVCPGASRI